jgi:hypothetical protein
MAVPLLADAAVSGFLQQWLQGSINGFTRAENPRTHSANGALHDAGNVLVTQTVKFTQG